MSTSQTWALQAAIFALLAIANAGTSLGYIEQGFALIALFLAMRSARAGKREEEKKGTPNRWGNDDE